MSALECGGCGGRLLSHVVVVVVGSWVVVVASVVGT